MQEVEDRYPRRLVLQEIHPDDPIVTRLVVSCVEAWY